MRYDLLGATTYQSPYFLGRGEISFHISSETVIKTRSACLGQYVSLPCFSLIVSFLVSQQ